MTGSVDRDDSEPGADRTAAKTARAGALRSLRNQNFRRYLLGQTISQTGNWFQVTAEIWLILLITESATAIGIHSVLRFGPLTLFGIPAGLVTDRFDHLRLFWLTQAITAATGVVLAVASFSSSPSLVLIYVVVFARGIVFAVDNPLRRSFVRDLVTDVEMSNAVSLNSSANTIARSLGPAMSGIVIATAGVAWCFTINALSFVPVFVTLLLIDRSKLRPSPVISRAKGQIREGLAYARRSRRIRRTLLMVAILGLFPLNWQVVLPVYASDTFAGGAELYGFMTSLMAVGAFIGATIIARETDVVGAHFRKIGGAMAGAFVLVALAPNLVVAFIGLAMLGAAMTSFTIAANSRLQLESDDAMSGRVLAIYSVALVGTRPIGGFATGVVVDGGGPRLVFGLSAVIVLVVTATLAFGATSRARWAPRAVIGRSRSTGSWPRRG